MNSEPVSRCAAKPVAIRHQATIPSTRPHTPWVTASASASASGPDKIVYPAVRPIAGYSAETQRFLDSNPGLQSRFNTVVRFADYTPTEMLQVIHVMAQKQSYSLAAGCDEILNGYFARRPQGNGRLCRNVLEAATQEAALRLQPRLSEASKEELAEVTPADLKTAISRLQ